MGSNTPSQSATVALAGGVFITGCLGEFVREAHKAAARPSGIGIVRGRLLFQYHTNNPPHSRDSSGCFRSLSSHSYSITDCIENRAGGTFRRHHWPVCRTSPPRSSEGGQLPSPIVLVTPADLALRLDNLGLVTIILVGMVTDGLLSLVSTFGGVGVATLLNRRG